MDFFEHRYYKLSKTFMMLSGGWPYHSTRVRYGIFVFIILTITLQVVPQILALMKHRHERGIVSECIITFLFESICVTKGIGCLWNSQKIIELLNRTRTNWQVWARDREVNILHKYAERGRWLSLAITAETYLIAFIYVAQPTIPKIIDVLLKNGTAPGEFPTPVDYCHLDSQKYYFSIVMYTYVFLAVGMILFVTSEIMLITYVQHACGIFAALGCKLQRIGNCHTSVQSVATSYVLDKRDIADFGLCIDRHNCAIEYVNLIEATYTWIFFCHLVLGMTALNVVGLQILRGKSNPEATIRFIGVALTSILHLYVDCYISQILINHSISLHFYIYDSQWYRLTQKVQNLLQLMIMRCSVPCKLTAGCFLIYSMKTFGLILRTVMSYFTVLRSKQI